MEPKNTPDITLIKNSDQQKESDRVKGKTGAWLLSGILIILILVFSVEKMPDGTYGRSINPPFLVWGVLFPMLFSSLGVPVDAEKIGSLLNVFQPKG